MTSQGEFGDVGTGYLTGWSKDIRALLLASDPSLARLRMASRVTLTLLAVAVSLAGLHVVVPLPVAAYGVAIITAMQGALAIRDAGAAARALTRCYCGIAGFAAVALATGLAPVPYLADALFLVLVFSAVYARKYGARWNAVGMFAFMCYFMGNYLHPTLADLPGVAAAIVLSGVISHIIRNLVLPERRADDFRRAVVAIGQRIEDLRQTISEGEAAGWPQMSRRKAVRRQERVTDAVLIAEGFLPLASIDDSPERAVMARLAVALFDLHLASETAVMAGLEAGRPTRSARAQTPRTNGNPTESALRRLAEALRLMREEAGAVADEAFEGALAAPGAATASNASSGFFSEPALRLAIQVTLASGIAMSGGLLLSKTRWFWAILTAFLVFTNTQSRGDTALRALNRVAGTVAGIVGGIGLATLLHGQFALSIGLAILFVFTGFYLLQISYAAMTFFVTLVLSLLYGLLGEFTPELLVLRLEETLIGVAAGTFIAFVVFPQSTSTVAGSAAGAFLGALDDLLAAAAARVAGKTAPNLVALSRLLDRRYAELATLARPLGSNWQIVQKPGRVRQTLLRFMGMAHWSRILARSLSGPQLHGAMSPAGKNEELQRTIAALRSQIAEIRQAGARLFDGVPQGRASSRRPDPGGADLMSRPDDPHFALAVLAHILDRTAQGGERAARLAEDDTTATAATSPAGPL